VQRVERTKPITIGRPIANTTIYILDAHLQPVPIGVPGELHIGGAGVARGYFNRPELTAEKFIPDPFDPASEGRLYKTGDVCRYRPNGELEFIGRIDDQVKIRGFRIELGEIETRLGQHPAVQEAIVLAREDIPGDKRLVAYLIAKRDATLSLDHLRHYLQEYLPEYMIPSAFVVLEQFPLTPNGKVDRRALPIPDPQSSRSQSSILGPRTPTEATLLAIWSEVLRISPISVEDDFFKLGGHSLLAIQVISRIGRAFNREIQLQSLFEHSTIAQLAEYIDTLDATLAKIHSDVDTTTGSREEFEL
jgi:acyl carrier protein